MIKAIVSDKSIEVTLAQTPAPAAAVEDRTPDVWFAQAGFITTRVEQSPVEVAVVTNENEEVP